MNTIKRKLNKEEIYFLIARFILVFSTISLVIFSFQAIWMIGFGLPNIGDFIIFFNFAIPLLVVYGTADIMKKQKTYSKEIMNFQTKDELKKTLLMIFLLFVIAPLIVQSIFGEELIAYMNSKG